MAILKESKFKGKREINLSGPQGNAYFLLGTAADVCRQAGIDFKPIEEDMTSGDYEHLIAVFDKHFGGIYDLVR